MNEHKDNKPCPGCGSKKIFGGVGNFGIKYWMHRGGCKITGTIRDITSVADVMRAQFHAELLEIDKRQCRGEDAEFEAMCIVDDLLEKYAPIQLDKAKT